MAPWAKAAFDLIGGTDNNPRNIMSTYNPTSPGSQSVEAPVTGEYLENGRYYPSYKRGQYMFPCDEEERDRLDVFHRMYFEARKGHLHSAPLARDRQVRILDAGTGTGIWAIQMADTYQNALLTGTDLTMMQPNLIPANARFLQSDMEAPWSLGETGWDMIHVRAMMGSIARWDQFYHEVTRHLLPGEGRLEHVEIDWTPRCDDGTLAENAAVRTWAHELMGVMDETGRPMRFDPPRQRQLMAEAGLVDITEEIIKVPFNGWEGDLADRPAGRFFFLGPKKGIEALSLAPFCRYKRMSPEEVKAVTDKVISEVSLRRNHGYCNLYVWTARRR